MDLLDFKARFAEARITVKARSTASPFIRRLASGWTCFRRALMLAVLTGLAGEVRAGEVLFARDVMAVLSKAGCNSGPCHGNANGKGGFKLSLRGEDPLFDFHALTRDQFARRADPFAPDQSLLLLKATAQIAHEGAKRFDPASPEYRILRDWIAGGLKTDPPGAPKLVRLEITPREQILVAPARTAQISATAVFSDGARRPVTNMAVYEPSTPAITVTHDGLASSDQPGEGTVIVRYLDQQAPVRLAFVPARPDFKWQRVPENNYIDRHIFAQLRRLWMNPSELASDEVFIRRAHFDLLGIPPTADEARAFVADRSRDKRTKLVDRLLERPEFAEYWAQKWMDLLRAEERALDRKGLRVLYDWLRDSFARNKPLDQFAREIIGARGSTYENPPANFYRAVRTPVERAEAAAQVFLGVRLQCAQCHSHPFDRWTQNDYYQWAALFAQVDYKIIENRRRDSNDKHEFDGEQIVFIARKGNVKDPRTGKAADPRFLGENEMMAEQVARRENRQRDTATVNERGPDYDYLAELAGWLGNASNDMFARVQANRVWFHLMGRGLVEPLDDFRATNPASHPALLDELARDFVKRGFDLRHLIRTIMQSRTYQLSSEPNATNAADEANFSRAYIRRLGAEQIMDAQSQALGVPLEFPGYPPGLRAAQIPGLPTERRQRDDSAGLFQFMQTFGKPPRLIPSECERSCEPTMSQAFQMISGPLLNERLGRPDNRLGTLLAASRPDRDIIEQLYLETLTRRPGEPELAKSLAHVQGAKDRRAAFEDILWSLLNAKEFVLRK
jgi:hypothetical protein